MVPFWFPITIRYLVFRVPKKGQPPKGLEHDADLTVEMKHLQMLTKISNKNVPS